MGLVLILVPALLAMQLDIARHVRAFRRAMRQRKSALPVTLAVSVAVVSGFILFALTMAPALTQNVVPPLVQTLFPALSRMPAIPAAFVAFAMGLVAVALVVYILAALLRGFGWAITGRKKKTAGNVPANPA